MWNANIRVYDKVARTNNLEEQPLRGVPKKRYSENMQQIYSRTAMPKCDFDKVASELWF